METQLNEILREALSAIGCAETQNDVELLRVEYLGKKGKLTLILRGMGKLSDEEKPRVGKLANEVREALEDAISDKKAYFEQKSVLEKLSKQTIDVTLSGKKLPAGHEHPLYLVLNQMLEVYQSLGFSVVEGPEIEWVKYNFDNLNVPLDHSSRDYSDTFYFTDDILLRTQTSPVQIRAMMGKTPPLKILSPGKVYRNDEIDATHSPLFHQLEGLIIDEGITMADLKGTLDYVAKILFGEETTTRFRPHQFYFTEPSAEMDASCFACKGKGCRICKGTGYIELLGCGMVHPNVLRLCGIDPDKYTGFAFGMGLERSAMFKYGISDMRLLFGNDTEFLTQF
ncbi:MAG: phenylalanine--tRNA ligase subunit alpha [Eubacteriaceae bacterium]|nr:phenylalanine--tRNA ligase subunit alpha [Eubacteriaceae bacterium]